MMNHYGFYWMTVEKHLLEASNQQNKAQKNSHRIKD